MAAGFSAYAIWGLFPLYLKALVGVAPVEVLAHRVLWSSALLAVVTLVTMRLGKLREVTLSTWAMLFGSAICIGTNWLLYLSAVMGGHGIDASLGYFILPLISVLFGVALLGERLTRSQWAAVALAALGVVAIADERGALPLVSLGLAVSFALYGLIRNRAPVDPLTGLLIETVILAPVAGWWLMAHGHAFGQARGTDLLLVGTAIITTVPLMLFGWAARRLKLSTLGLLQYISPSLVFLLAVFRYHEPLSAPQLGAFALIWAGLLLYVADGWRRARAVSVPREAR